MSINVNVKQLAALQVAGLLAAPEGPKAVPVLLDFSQTNQYNVDLSNYMARTFITMVQALYLDNSGNNAPLIVNIGNGGQLIQIAPNRQGYFMILCPNPVNYLSFSSQGGVIVNAYLLNFPVATHDWPCVTGA